MERQTEDDDLSYVEDEGERNLKPVRASVLPAPESTQEGQSILSSRRSPKGVFGAAIRVARGVPPHIRVVNKHTEEITVVVSKYAPHRQLSGVGLEGSTTGAGINFTTAEYIGKATTKTLLPESEDPLRCSAFFPLWTRRNGFGVVTIFTGTGSEKKLYIENDRVAAGVTVNFTNSPDLEITT